MERTSLPTNSVLATAFAIVLIFASITGQSFAQGVAVVDAVDGEYLHLSSGDVRVSVEGQVAIVTSTETFVSVGDTELNVDYAFPMPENGSATSLRWKINGSWYEAVFSPTPQDTSITNSGDPIDTDLVEHIGSTPLYFEVEQPLAPDSLLTIELTYVQLLPYEFGDVTFTFSNNYERIQAAPIESQFLQFDLVSPRTIERIDLTSHVATAIENDGTVASVRLSTGNTVPDSDYRIRYSLSLSELGLFGFSTFLPDSLVGDEAEQGFFAFVVEPDAGENTETIEKVFTLIIDRSGSMSGSKIEQAKNAASFIVENLNDGDHFNIVDFNNEIENYKADHVPYSSSTRDEALAYIDRIRAGGSTNISGAFGTAIPQFRAADSSIANIIVFFTDGLATAGITDTQGILTHVENLKTINETQPIIFTFGIGSSVDRQLLTRLATENNGLVEFLGGDELEDRITSFYLRIRNPVVLGTQIAFTPSVVTEVYPDPLPGLYKGQQVIVSGRYNEAVPIQVTLSGQAFGQPVSYSYGLDLSTEETPKYQFLTKVWAKLKIEDLLLDYFLLDSGSEQAEVLRNEITELSLAFGVISPFSSFRAGEDDNTGTTEVEEPLFDAPTIPQSFRLTGNYPNPFTESTTLTLEVTSEVFDTVLIQVYDSLGRLVRILSVQLTGAGEYTVQWDGRSSEGQPVTSGVYVYTVIIGDTVLAGTMTKLR